MMRVMNLYFAVTAVFISISFPMSQPAFAADYGAYQITTDPANTTVYVNGKKKGTSTPLSLKLKEGDYRIKLDNRCCDIVEFNVFIGADTVQKKEVKLVRLVFPRKRALPKAKIIMKTPMTTIPAGNFSMGSNNGNSDEKPVHTVYLNEYKIDKYEATAWQFAQFLNAKGNPDEKYMKADNDSTVKIKGGKYRGRTGYENHPANNVSWLGADAYCRWAGKKLPTEAEWEKAARGTDGRKYPWGNQEPGNNHNLAVYEFDNHNSSVTDIIPVDSLKAGASPYGLHHMAGNVWEWTADWYSSYKKSPSSNPKGPSSGSSRVLRGGS